MRYILHRHRRSDEDDEDLAESIEKLKKELQQSADTIIKRLGSHVTKLEGLLREAEDRRRRLETRVVDAQRIEWALRQRIEELERRLRDLGQVPPTMQPRQTEPAPAPVHKPVQEARRTDGDDFASVLHASILREQTRAAAKPSQSEAPSPAVPRPAQPRERLQMPASPYAQPLPSTRTQPPVAVAPLPPQQEEEVPVEEGTPVQKDEAIIKARALLRAGRTIEQVARETGVEIGALRLMKQMTQRD